jgi:hypothetical protein
MSKKTEKVCLWILKDKRALQATRFQLIPLSKPIKAPSPILSESAENSQKVAKEWQIKPHKEKGLQCDDCNPLI